MALASPPAPPRPLHSALLGRTVLPVCCSGNDGWTGGWTEGQDLGSL